MSKLIKRIASMLMVVVLVLSMSIPVFASDIDDPIGRSCVASGVYSITRGIHK